MKQSDEQYEAEIKELNEKIKDLEDWNAWYKMWHENFKRQIDKLTEELETYRPTKLDGNGQCKCYGCEQKGKFGVHWTSWCSKYKGHVYCSSCLEEVLESENPKPKSRRL